MMLDWIIFLDDVLGWIQLLTTFTIVGLIGLACLMFFISKKMAIDCGLLAVVLIIVASVLQGFGIQIISPAVFEFFHKLF